MEKSTQPEENCVDEREKPIGNYRSLAAKKVPFHHPFPSVRNTNSSIRYEIWFC
jgi:hypothetical protein